MLCASSETPVKGAESVMEQMSHSVSENGACFILPGGAPRKQEVLFLPADTKYHCLTSKDIPSSTILIIIYYHLTTSWTILRLDKHSDST